MGHLISLTTFDVSALRLSFHGHLALKNHEQLNSPK